MLRHRKIVSLNFLLKIVTVLFLFSSSISWGQTIVSDNFENTTTLFSNTGGTYYSGTTGGTDGPASSPLSSLGTYGLGRSAASGSAVATSSLINTASCSSVQMSFKLASFSTGGAGNGADAGDFVRVEISPDGGTNYYSTIQINGNSNAFWGFSSGTGVASTAYDGDASAVTFAPAGGGARTTDGYSTVTITGLPAVTNLIVRITMLNNSTNERWVIDNFVLSGICSSCAPPTTTITPTSQTVCSTATISISSSATIPTYQWQMSANGTSGWTNVVNGTPTGVTYSGATSASLIATGTSTAQYFYQCLVTENGTCTATSGTASLTINTTPSITSQPSNVSTTTGGSGSFSVGVAGSALSFQWQENTGSGFANITNGGSNPTYVGATTASLTVSSPPLSMSGYSYQCIVSNACGTVTCNTATLGVTTGPCVTETFSNIPMASNTTYTVRTWTGDNGFAWTSTDSRSDQTINGSAVTIRNGSLTANNVSNGIGSLTLVTKLPFADAAGNLSIYINGSLVGTAPYSSTTQTTTISNINISGTFTISIVSPSGARVTIDDVSWTCFSSTNTIITGVVSSPPFALTSCTSTASGTVEFTSTGTFDAGNIYTAQLSNASGSFASPVNVGTLSSTANSGTINITIPVGTSAGTGYLIRILGSNPNVTGSSSVSFSITTTCTTSTCPYFIAAVVNACAGSCGAEGQNEMAVMNSGSYNIPVNGTDLNIYYSGGTNHNFTNSFAVSSGTVVSNLNSLAGCGSLFQFVPSGGTIPSNSTFFILNSNSCFNGDFSSYCGMGTIYVVISTDADWTTSGYFGNNNTPRYFQTNFTTIDAGCATVTYSYNNSSEFDFGSPGGTAGDGNSVVFSGTSPSYISGGGSCVPPVAILPVELIDFYGTQNGPANDLVWKVASEKNVSQYMIEKSEDGVNFSELTRVNAIGAEASFLAYSCKDQDPFSGITYYRLSTLESNQTINHYSIIDLDRGNKDWKSLIYQENDELVVEWKNYVPKDATIALLDLSGKQLVDIDALHAQTKINTNGFAAGIYFVRISTPYKTENFKIVIQRY
ncbi:MAG: C-terminal target protein [Bacteroidetes bacterium]|jgi:hypothetical protein|nr:C-terminal target protein [Bacteroidota bacterium]